MASEKTNFPLDDIGGQRGMRVMESCAKVILRGKPDDDAFMMAAHGALGFALPAEVGKTARAKNSAGINITAFCLAPDEWMLWAADDERAALLEGLQEALDGVFGAAVDVSDYYAVICLEGDNAGDMLASGCPLDIAGLQVGECAQSHYGMAQILLHRTAAGFDLQTRISMARYLWMRLAVSG